MEKSCGACGSGRFRVSRFRFSDLPKLFAFQYPIRCMTCQERTYASVPWVVEHRRSRTRKS